MSAYGYISSILLYEQPQLRTAILLYTKLRNAGPHPHTATYELRNAGPSHATRTRTYFMCPHTALYLASAYSYTCVRIFRILPYMCPHTLYISRPHTPIHVSAYYYVCVRILLYVCRFYCIGVDTLLVYGGAVCVRILLHVCRHSTA